MSFSFITLITKNCFTCLTFFLFIYCGNFKAFHIWNEREWRRVNLFPFQSILSTIFLFYLPSADPSVPVLPRNSKNYFFFPSLFDFSCFSPYQAEVSFGSIHSSSLSSLSLSESVSSMATRRARIDATSWRFDCFWCRISSRSCSTLRSLMPKSC